MKWPHSAYGIIVFLLNLTTITTHRRWNSKMQSLSSFKIIYIIIAKCVDSIHIFSLTLSLSLSLRNEIMLPRWQSNTPTHNLGVCATATKHPSAMLPSSGNSAKFTIASDRPTEGGRLPFICCKRSANEKCFFV